MPPFLYTRFTVKKIYLSLLLLPSILFAGDAMPPPDLNLPWLTGPLLAPSGHVVPAGHIDIEPYNYFTFETGVYDSKHHHHSTPHVFSWSLPFLIQAGIAENWELDIVPELVSNHFRGHNFTSIGDTTVQLKYQVQNEPAGLKFPSNISINQSFPTGKYQKFSPGNELVQGTGSGAFVTTLGYTATRIYHVHKESFLVWRSFIGYSVASRVHVHGFNNYGGGFHANGYVYPGGKLTWILGAEYSLNRNWVLACDIQYLNQSKTRFTGNPGTLRDGRKSHVGLPSSWQWSIAPALEYNFNFHVGIIGGVWLTFAGKNTTQFTSGVIAVNLYY